MKLWPEFITDTVESYSLEILTIAAFSVIGMIVIFFSI